MMLSLHMTQQNYFLDDVPRLIQYFHRFNGREGRNESTPKHNRNRAPVEEDVCLLTIADYFRMYTNN